MSMPNPKDKVSPKKLGNIAAKVAKWLEEGKDTNGNEISVGDPVTFGEKHTKGTVLGFAEDGRLKVEVLEEKPSQKGKDIWRYVFLMPSVQAEVVRVKLDPETEEPAAHTGLYIPADASESVVQGDEKDADDDS